MEQYDAYAKHVDKLLDWFAKEWMFADVVTSSIVRDLLIVFKALDDKIDNKHIEQTSILHALSTHEPYSIHELDVVYQEKLHRVMEHVKQVGTYNDFMIYLKKLILLTYAKKDITDIHTYIQKHYLECLVSGKVIGTCYGPRFEWGAALYRRIGVIGLLDSALDLKKDSCNGETALRGTYTERVQLACAAYTKYNKLRRPSDKWFGMYLKKLLSLPQYFNKS